MTTLREFPKKVIFIREHEINLDPEEDLKNEEVIVVENEWDWCYTRYYMGSRGYIIKETK